MTRITRHIPHLAHALTRADLTVMLRFVSTTAFLITAVSIAGAEDEYTADPLFVDFDSEITLLTLRTVAGTMFCSPIGHRQEDGDYVESWQPHAMNDEQLALAEKIAGAVTERLGGEGIFGVELFLLNSGEVIFSEVSPRPHDTGMVTMATQNWSQFALHARAILGMPIKAVNRYCEGASVAWKSSSEVIDNPVYEGVENAFATPGIDLRIFGKPVAHSPRRLGVVLASDQTVASALAKAKQVKQGLVIKDGSTSLNS